MRSRPACPLRRPATGPRACRARAVPSLGTVSRSGGRGSWPRIAIGLAATLVGSSLGRHVAAQTTVLSGTLSGTQTFNASSGSATITGNCVLSGTVTLGLGFGVEYLVLGGGGAGGARTGGGAGGFLTGTSFLATGTANVVVGAGGVATGTGEAVNGGASRLGSLLADGGGGPGRNGGSGGGAPSGGGPFGTPTGNGVGNRGGLSSSGLIWGGGGGGAGAPGQGGESSNSSLGGNGLPSSISGTSRTYAGGGGGGTASSGGSGGGGASGSSGQSGATNTGGGGGGGDTIATAGNGGSGIVIARYRGSAFASGGTVTSGSGSATGYTLHTYTTTGSSSFVVPELGSRLRATLSARLFGYGGLVFNGPGVLTLTGGISYTGATRVAAGTLALGNVNALANSPLDLDGGGAVAFAVAGTGTYAVAGLQGSGALDIGANSLAIGGNGASTTFAGTIAGSGGITKSGAGTLTLTGNNSYSGDTVIAAGTLAVGSAQALGSAGSILFAGGALQYQGVQTDYSARFSTAASQPYQIDTNGEFVTFSSPLTSVGSSLNKLGFGVLQLNSGNSFEGGITLSLGGIRLAHPEALGSTGTISFVGGGLGFTEQNLTDYSSRFSSAAGQAYWLEVDAGWGVTLSSPLTSAGGTLLLGGGGVVILTGNNTYSGLTTIQEGILSIGNGGTSGFVNGNIKLTSQRSELAFNRSDDVTYSGAISGVGSLTKLGAGTLTLTGSNSYAGLTTVSAGTLAIGNGGTTGSLAGNIANNAAVTFNRSDASTYSGAISGVGSFTKLGTGTLTLTGSNSYGGTTTVAAGTLVASTPNTLPGYTAAGRVVFGGGTLQVPLDGVAWTATQVTTLLANATKTSGILAADVASGSQTLAGAITGGIRLTKLGAGTLTLTGSNIYTGLTTVSAGTLSIGDGGTSGSVAGDIANAAAIIFNRSDASTYSGAISGVGSLTKLGAGTLTLTGSNSYAGLTTVSAGTLAIGNGGTTGSLAGNIANNAAVTFNRSDANTYSGVISGSGSLTKTGVGTLTLTGSNTYTGLATVSAGTLSIGDGGTTGSVAGDIANAAAIIFNRSDASTYSGAISGVGSLTKTGAGTLTLGNANTFTGVTRVTGGTLALGNTQALAGSMLDLAAGDTGAVTFTVAGTNTYALGGLQGSRNLAIGANTLAIGASGVSTTYAGGISGSGGLTKTGTGTLTLTGSNSYGGTTTVAAGTLVASTPNTLPGYTAAGRVVFGGGTLQVPLDGVAWTATQVTTLLANATKTSGILAADVASGSQTLAGAITGGIGLTKLGAGALTLTGSNSFTGPTRVVSGTLVVGSTSALAGSTLDLAAADAGTVSLHSSLTRVDLGGLQGSRNLAVASQAVWIGGNNASTEFSGQLTGFGSVVKTGSGLLTLSGNNTLSGLTTVSGGTLSIGNGGTTGAIAGNLVTNAEVVFNRSDAVTYSGGIVGTGVLTKQGAGTLTVTSGNTYTGGTRLLGGTLALGVQRPPGASGAIGTAGTISFGGGTLRWETADTSSGFSFGIDYSPRFSNAANQAYSIDTNGRDVTFAAGLSSVGGSLTKLGAGTLTLSASNSYSGATTVTAGTLVASAPNTLPGYTSAGRVVFNGGTLQVPVGGSGWTPTQVDTLVTNATKTGGALALDVISGSQALAAAISGPIGLTKVGAGTLVLTGSNSYSGPTVVSEGTLAIGNGGTAGSVAGDIANGGALVFNRSDSVAFAGSISGTGGLTKAGAGTLSLTGSSSSSGRIDVTAGTLQVAGAVLGSGTGGNPLVYVAPSSGQTAAFTVQSGTVARGAASGIIVGDVGTGTFSQSGGSVTIGSGGFWLGNNAGGVGAANFSGGTFTSTASTLIVATRGVGTVTVSGSANVTLATLQLGHADGAGTTSTVNLDGGLLAADRVTRANGTASFFFNGGTLSARRNDTSFMAGLSRAEVKSGGAVIDTAGFAVTIGQNLASSTSSPGGGLVKLGAGTLTLSGSNSYSGGTVVSAGTLSVAAANALGSGAVVLGNAATGSSAVTLRSSFDVTRDITVAAGGSGVATIAGDANFITYSGALSLARPTTIGGTAADRFAVSGRISGAVGTLTIDAPRVTFDQTAASANTFTGSVAINPGRILQLNTVNGLSGAHAVAANGTLYLVVGTGSTATIGTLSGTGLVSPHPSVAGLQTLSVGGDNGSGTFAGTLTNGGGTLALVKAGNGTQTLSGSNGYTGGTTLSAGTLVATTAAALPGFGTAGRVVITGGTLQVALDGVAWTAAQVDALATNATKTAGVLALDVASGSQSLAGIGGAIGLTKLGAGTLTLSASNGYTGTTRVAAGTLALGNVNALANSTLDLAGGGAVAFAVAGTGTYAVAALQGSGALDVGANSLAIGGNGASTTFAGTIAGSGGITKSGAGTLTLTGSNSYSGGTVLSAGTLAVGNPAALGTTGPIAFGGGVLRYEPGNTTDYSARFSTAVNQAIAIDTNGQDVSLATALTSSGGSLTKLGAGALRLSGNNTYSGGTVVSDGELVGDTTSLQGAITNNAAVTFDQAGNGTYAGSMSGAGSLTKTNSGTLTLTGANSYGGGTVVSAGRLVGNTTSLQGAITNNAAVTFDQAGNGTYAGSMSGAGSLTKTNSGTLTLTGNNSYGGGTVVAGGRVTGNTASLQGAITINDSAELRFKQSSPGIFSGTLFGGGQVVKDGTSSLTLATANLFSGWFAVEGGGQLIIDHPRALEFSTLYALQVFGGGSVIFSDNSNTYILGSLSNELGGTFKYPTSLDFGNASITVGGNNRSTLFFGTLSGGGGLKKVGTGTMTLVTGTTLYVSSGSNTYGGGTTLSAGTLVADSASVIPGYGTAGRVVFDGGTLQVRLNGSSWTAAQVASLAANATKTAGVLALEVNGANQTLDGSIGGAIGLRKLGGSALTLSASNSYSGATRVAGGTLALGHVQALAGSTLDLASGDTGTVTFTVAGTNTYALGGLQGSRSLALGANSIAVGGNGLSTAYSGVVSGSGGLIKAGTGTLSLTGNNTFTGATSVAAGRLFVNGRLASTTTTVAALALLGGSGTVSGSVVVQSGGTLSPGTSPGILTVGSLTLEGGAVTLVEIVGTGAAGSAFDQVRVTAAGGLAYGGELALDFANRTTPFTTGATWQLFSFSGSATGDFSAIRTLDTAGPYANLVFSPSPYVPGEWFSGIVPGAGDQYLVFSEASGRLVALPEPSAFALVALGIGIAGRHVIRARRRRQG